MIRYIAARLGWAAPTVLLIVILNFIIIHVVPGDPVSALVGDFPSPPGYVESVRASFGLDKPILTQLWLYLVNMAQGNLGFSFANRQPVLDLVLSRAQLTLLLMIPSLLLSAVLGIMVGMAAAPRAGKGVDSFITTLSLLGYSIPIFWLGQLLITVFAIQFNWLPAQGMISLRVKPTGMAAAIDVFWHMVLPVACITTYYAAIVARVARASVIEALHHDYILTARAKGLSARETLWKHALPNAIVPVITVIGYNFGYSLTGAILVESVFAWPGVGALFLSSVGNRDYPVLQGIFLLAGFAVVCANLVTDIACALVDPRVRKSQSGGQ